MTLFRQGGGDIQTYRVRDDIVQTRGGTFRQIGLEMTLFRQGGTFRQIGLEMTLFRQGGHSDR